MDGWEITFDRFVIAISGVGADHAGASLSLDPATYIVDLAKDTAGTGHMLTNASVPAELHYHLRYTIAPPASGAPVAVNVDADQVAQMVDGGYSLWVQGRAVRGAETKTFAWGFTTNTRYSECHATAWLKAAETGTAQATIHSDHVFYDSLISEEPGVAFDLIASADANADGEVTTQELLAVDITGQAKYQVGNQTDVQNLWAYMAAQTRTLGHVDGEGHCDQVD